MSILQTSFFGKQKKKLYSNQIQCLDQALKEILENPKIGEQKKGDLNMIRVYKFKILKQECLLAYQIDGEHIILHSIGSHENFYRDLKCL